MGRGDGGGDHCAFLFGVGASEVVVCAALGEALVRLAAAYPMVRVSKTTSTMQPHHANIDTRSVVG